MDFDTPEQDEMQQSGSNFLSQPGIYHGIITAVYENLAPPKRDGTQKAIDGFSVSLDILAGTVAGQEGKTINLTFFNGKLNSKDQGKFARKKQAAFLIAANLITPAQLGQRVSINLDGASGQQVVMKLEKDEENSTADATYLQLAFADIWHVDDPRCESHPKKAEAIALIPQQWRHDAKFFESLMKPGTASSGANSNGSSGSKRETATASAGAGSSSGQAKRPAVDVNDL